MIRERFLEQIRLPVAHFQRAVLIFKFIGFHSLALISPYAVLVVAFSDHTEKNLFYHPVFYPGSSANICG